MLNHAINYFYFPKGEDADGEPLPGWSDCCMFVSESFWYHELYWDPHMVKDLSDHWLSADRDPDDSSNFDEDGEPILSAFERAYKYQCLKAELMAKIPDLDTRLSLWLSLHNVSKNQVPDAKDTQALIDMLHSFYMAGPQLSTEPVKLPEL